jgi:UDP-N-acetylglucosamine--N-acetylmuramyl-(pentapeptide) pyrophosphoryl-undecaprenol N-acetylglucosamine transferase
VKILIAGGGTGGHFFTGVAVGEAFEARSPKNQVIYVGTRQGIEARVGPEQGHDVRFIDARPLRGVSLGQKALALLLMPISIAQSALLVFKERPSMVMGVGGYASFPVVLAARLMFRMTGVVEQNSIPGLANRTLGRIVHRIFIAFEEARAHFPRRRTLITGNPIRGVVVELLTLESTGTVGIGDRLKVLVVGGTHGARRLNRAFVELAGLASDTLREKLLIVHQTGDKDVDRVRDAYDAAGIGCRVEPFIHEMGEAYRSADLVVCRAGALTVSELMISRRGSVLIPWPKADHNHQEANARTLVEAGAGEMILQSDLSGQRLSETLERLLKNRRELQMMAWRAGELARPQAAAEVVDEMYRAAGIP